jgi:tRNA A-37 threonylcarbamoyl transferase component Bud32
MGDSLHRLGSIGDRADDPPTERLRHRFLVYMGLLMSIGALVWGGLSLAFGLTIPSIIPFGYLVVTAVNLGVFAATKGFDRARVIQTFVSVLLPFLFQWSVGGFVASGAVMLWALVALVGALTFTRPRTMLLWLPVYAVLVIASGVFDPAGPAGRRLEIGFFVVNFVMISAVVVVLMAYFLAQLADAKAAIADLRKEVQDAKCLGQYTLVEKLGQGGMGAVYRARHAMLRRPTAIKLVRADRADEATIARFEREVQLTATLSHPNTVVIYDYGRADDGTFYYAMELLDGADLGVVMSMTGPMPIGRVVHVVTQVAQALAEAHKKGLIHRDIKPPNVLLTQAYVPDLVKVVDFGLVKEVARERLNQHETMQAGFAGTPSYMSPEALSQPDSVDARSDVYSLGCLAYYLLTASPVFRGDSTIEVCGHHLHTTPTPMSIRASREVPQPLEELVLSCLAKKPEARPATDTLVAALRGFSAEPWGRWDEADAAAWWRTNGAAVAAERERNVESVDRTVVARALAGKTPSSLGTDKTELGHKPIPAPPNAA